MKALPFSRLSLIGSVIVGLTIAWCTAMPQSLNAAQLFGSIGAGDCCTSTTLQECDNVEGMTCSDSDCPKCEFGGDKNSCGCIIIDGECRTTCKTSGCIGPETAYACTGS